MAATSIVCPELTPLLQGKGGGLGLTYNKGNLATVVSGKTEAPTAFSPGTALRPLGP